MSIIKARLVEGSVVMSKLVVRNKDNIRTVFI